MTNSSSKTHLMCRHLLSPPVCRATVHQHTRKSKHITFNLIYWFFQQYKSKKYNRKHWKRHVCFSKQATKKKHFFLFFSTSVLGSFPDASLPSGRNFCVLVFQRPQTPFRQKQNYCRHHQQLKTVCSSESYQEKKKTKKYTVKRLKWQNF